MTTPTIPEDKELNKLVIAIVKKLESKGIVAIDRDIEEYHINLKYAKITKNSVNNKKPPTERFGDALKSMSDEITQSFVNN